ncbi:MAG: DUF1858 domain-containing protein [Methanobrevibacter sp.]|uniref:DUF1858 domain-containing protein n=1 Tax=Methanobrevibacter sp. TaxID=66852 RepID=UPI001B0FF4CC|nr:DUF1858 domain-containing protein [Methanobrevibacter sp.]MBO5152603.1 DUF1858 domain-containing protein [Methanobrevibacter sp.]MBO6111138.1 DUF1858 domain-containing protein [Methanobrevibacter sp.]
MIEINENTRLTDILDEYPWIKDELPKIDKKFKLLKTPIGKVMMRKVDVSEMSRRSGMSVDEIISMLNNLIKNH